MVQALRWHPVEDRTALPQRAHDRILAAATAAIETRGAFRIVLAGGSTPRATYRLLRSADSHWQAWHVYYGDERCLPREDPERNSAMVDSDWLDHVPVPLRQRHPIPAERGPRRAARLYSRLLRDVDLFDLVLLGLGEDGHTASLFPGHDWGLAPDGPTVLPVFAAPKPPPERVSLSAARLSHTRQVLFLVSGESKRTALERWRRGEKIPAEAIAPAGGVDVLVDAALLEAPGRG